MSLDITPVTVTGTWWRHLPAGGDPAYRSEPPASGRWQRGDTVAALYLAGDEDTCWAEWYRRLADDAITPLQALPRDLWRYAVALDGVAALDTDERLAAVGLRAPRPSRADWSAYQAVGERLWHDGYAGILFA
ncbi:MAG TPA: RES family NAD+ phosphorylase, partial [Kofleriaceae bacterium]|nr:RES family NAD+ phosphorylase [Kofleriaceae bacterium]